MAGQTAAERLLDAIATETEALAERPDAMLTGYYLVAEWLDPDGNRWLTRASSPDSVSWQRQGWLGFALDWERASAHEEDD